MTNNPEGRKKDIVERFGDLTFGVQALGALGLTLVGLMPAAAATLGTFAAIDKAGTNMYKQGREFFRRKLGGIASR